MRIMLMIMCYIMHIVPRINIYLDAETKEQLKQVSEKENRPVSRQIKHMLEFYIQHKDQV